MEQTMREILSETPRFSSRAEYFSGRGATLTDLNDEILTHIHKEIKEKFGDEPAQNFVKMVASMENCNATDFINNCYKLEYCDFKWEDKKSKKNGIEIAKDKDGNYNELHGMISMFGAMTNDRDETDAIRGRFLMRHGASLGEEIMYMDSNHIMYKNGRSKIIRWY